MAGNTLDLEHVLEPDNLASEIGVKFAEWSTYRRKWIEQKKELRNYVFATDTTTTANAVLPWSNSTTTPKLTQIMDNLHANYYSSLFPQSKWMRWKADAKVDGDPAKARIVESYLYHKMDKSDFYNTVSDLLMDYIIYGNCFAKVIHETDLNEAADGSVNVKYVGPKLTRISPFDIVFNPAATDFTNTPKITKSIKTIGEIAKLAQNNSEYQQVFDRMVTNRATVLSSSDVDKSEAYIADGFNSIQQYYGSDYVEVLTFYGDLYDSSEKVLYENHEIIVLDRAYVLSNTKGESWFGSAPIFHAGWRPRPDNLYAMGPLDNLVGLQYRIDHLENLKADVFDQIAYPVKIIRGDVEDFDWEPGTEIYVGEEGDVRYLQPDSTALQADMQIDMLQNRMEELAGAPRQAMGIRTPGEKTAFEVQSLDNSSSRIFQHKTAHFERTFIEPVMNAMLELGRRNMDRSEEIPMQNEQTGGTFFISDLTKKDLLGQGKLVPMGARHFAERARRVQNLTQLLQAKADPSVAPHLSGKVQAKIMAEELGEPDLFGENISVKEQLETQQASQDAEATNMEGLMDAQERGI